MIIPIKSTFAIYVTHGEYDGFVKHTIATCHTLKETLRIVQELKDYLEFKKLGELLESEFCNTIYKEYGLSTEDGVGWEEIPLVTFEEM